MMTGATIGAGVARAASGLVGCFVFAPGGTAVVDCLVLGVMPGVCDGGTFIELDFPGALVLGAFAFGFAGAAVPCAEAFSAARRQANTSGARMLRRPRR
jgi:hypothetical protein